MKEEIEDVTKLNDVIIEQAREFLRKHQSTLMLNNAKAVNCVPKERYAMQRIIDVSQRVPNVNVNVLVKKHKNN
jgi:hypothetical protein